ncbi:lipopolysaccharide heptosyltransferase I [Permianibacter sp. IMCC34836]|uniref:lipopolysaccharide heptosyltransferase I n=1 Tax=Permianibacter fluminis TaxID=2738515 RepID=UPI0015574314|nr:lipopolysaccharide heptosyltransferase I [Permianibacter fluminis]NQD35440.1 lipopolysaccharide heptosyltransferase I [Permianibacter fluminis]
MRLLVVKTSSLGDVIHALPALTDAMHAIPGLRADWLVEQAFAEIPAWHPAVDTVIPVAVRRWRKQPLALRRDPLWQAFRQQLAHRTYDLVIDAQGLLKSALLARYARGPKAGFSFNSVRETLAALFYRHRYVVARDQHAVLRQRELFAKTLGYALPDTAADYGLRKPANAMSPASPALMFFHGTTWASKHWPEPYWLQLAQRAVAAGYQVWLPWGNDVEKARAERIASVGTAVKVLPRSSLSDLAARLQQVQGVVAVDTGLGHLAAALGVPSVSLYGATNPALTSTHGAGQLHLPAQFGCAPCLQRDCTYKGASSVKPACYETVAPERVWHSLQQQLPQPITLVSPVNKSPA